MWSEGLVDGPRLDDWYVDVPAANSSPSTYREIIGSVRAFAPVAVAVGVLTGVFAPLDAVGDVVGFDVGAFIPLKVADVDGADDSTLCAVAQLEVDKANKASIRAVAPCCGTTVRSKDMSLSSMSPWSNTSPVAAFSNRRPSDGSVCRRISWLAVRAGLAEG